MTCSLDHETAAADHAQGRIPLSGTGGTTTDLIHPYEIRKLTIAGIKALASYPKAFEIRGGYNARWARIGNSVPPLFMRAIACHIRRVLLEENRVEEVA